MLLLDLVCLQRAKVMVRVLYLHGLEETASSPKPACLVNDGEFDTSVPELDIYFTKRNSPIFSLLRAPSFIALAASCFVLLCVSLRVGLSAWLALC